MFEKITRLMAVKV